ncbi:MAG: acyl-CoA reductase [Saprospiraceae bacterium]
MTLNQRIALLVQLGEYLVSQDELLHAVMHRTHYNNRWLTIENCEKAAKHITQNFLQSSQLENWANHYVIRDNSNPKKVGIIMNTDIPLVGFHDLLAVFLSGNQAIIKLSDKDKFLIPHLIKKMGRWNSEAKSYFEVVDRLTAFDAVIATGNNNATRYFEQYFGKYPNIIRKNRRTVAVLDGTETADELYALGNDVFDYFGLGTRNVSKLYIPKHFKFEPLLEAFHKYNSIVLNTKYKNNFDYNYAMFMLNKVVYKANGCIILIENEAITSRIASLHYEYYDKGDNLVATLNSQAAEIECVVSKMKLANIETVAFGKAQQPSLTDYADGADTMKFLINL